MFSGVGAGTLENINGRESVIFAKSLLHDIPAEAVILKSFQIHDLI